MPVYLSHDSSHYDPLKSAKVVAGKPLSKFRGPSANVIDIGLVNNMPDRAMQSTERQFLTLLDSAAAEDITVRLWLYALPDVPRSEMGQRHIAKSYSPIETLWGRHLDGLIVTGAEPKAENLKDEPYWGTLARLIDWAEHGTQSTVWSCLAAHAAVLHLNGITRRRLAEKRFGLFECTRVADHPLMVGGPASFVIPHSRWNDLPEQELTACGYSILTGAAEAGADAFVKQGSSLFVFFQGHPEYEANTLLLEYSRDVGRYLRRESETYPRIPQGYFDREAAEALASLRERAFSNRREDLLAEFPTALTSRNLATPWRPAAMRVYGNWLRYLCAHNDRKQPASHAPSVADRRFAAGE